METPPEKNKTDNTLKKKDSWDKWEIVGKLIGSVLIPIAIFWATQQYSTNLKIKEVQGKFVELSIDILKDPPRKENPQDSMLRVWATNVVNTFSDIKLNTSLTKELIVNLPLTQDSKNENHVNDFLPTYSDFRLDSCIAKEGTMRDGYIESIKYKIQYNKFGNPIKITNSKGGTGNPNYMFKYDSKNRLVEYIGYFDDPNKYWWVHKYKYGNANRIISDTYFYNDMDSAYNFNTYFYDSAGRLSKVETRYPGHTGVQETNVYHYDKNGNLVQPGAMYDQFINVHRLNPVWQFIDRDYSNNNAFKAESYDSFGLPVSYTYISGNMNRQAPKFLQLSMYNFSYSFHP